MVYQIFLLAFLAFLSLLSATVLLHIFFQIPYVPSRPGVVERMIKAAKLRSKDVVYDLGCGDARLIIAAAKVKGVRAEGFEIAPLVYLLARCRMWFSRAAVKIHFKNFFNANLKNANVIFCYLLPNALKKLSVKFKRECAKGTKIISHTFRIPEMKPTHVFRKNKKKHLPTIYVYQL